MLLWLLQLQLMYTCKSQRISTYLYEILFCSSATSLILLKFHNFLAYTFMHLSYLGMSLKISLPYKLGHSCTAMFTFLLLWNWWPSKGCSISLNIWYFIVKFGARDGLVVKALRYKPAGRGFDSRWCHWNFSVT